MTECETIIFIQKGLEVATKLAEQVGFNDKKSYEQARKWLDSKLSEAAAHEVSEMKKKRKEVKIKC